MTASTPINEQVRRGGETTVWVRERLRKVQVKLRKMREIYDGKNVI